MAIGRYALAIGFVGAAVGSTFLVQELGVRVFLFAFYAAVVASASMGTGPGCLSVVLSVLSVEYFWTPPLYSFQVVPEELPFMAAFIICAVMSLAWSWQRKRTERLLKEARDTLEITVAQRTAQLVEANAALQTEIAERRAAEEELRRNETLLAQGQKLSRTASWTLRPATGQMRWSAELFDMFGVAREATTPSYRLLGGRVHPDDRLRFEQQLQNAAHQRGEFSCEVRLLVDGTTKHVQVVGEVPPAGEHGVEIVGTVMDLTERKRTEQALHDAEAELARTLRLATVAELAASIAHEINQPLAAIVANGSACLRSLARRPPALGDAREAASCVVSDGTRAGEVIARIRALLSKQGPRHIPLDVNHIIGEVLALSRGALERQGITVHTELTASPLRVLGDPVQLQQLLVNLVNNAAEAMAGIVDRPRCLRIRSAVEPGDAVAVTVEDTGSGLDAADLDRIFDSFYTTKPERIGVGLSISRSIMEAHGGQLSVEPGVPHGARFTFTLPVAAAGSGDFGNEPAQSAPLAGASAAD